MKYLFFFFSICFISFSWGQVSDTTPDKMQADAFGRDNFQYPPGNIVGLGYTYFNYKTEWPAIYIDGEPTTTPKPIHNHQKSEVHVFLENRSIVQLGPFHLDGRGEIRFGVAGKSTQEYLGPLIDSVTKEGIVPPGADTKTISKSGNNFAGAAILKFAYPFDISPRIHLAPFAGLGLTFTLLEQQGDGITEVYKSGILDNLSYGSSWNEFSLYTPVSAGLNIDFENWSIIFDYRRSIWGMTETNWNPVIADPNNNAVPNPDPEAKYSATSQTFEGFAVSLAFRIGR